MANRVYGYARVSTADQNEGRQIEALKEAGVDERFIFLDKQSGKDFNRDEWKVLIRALREDDVLVIKSIDRLGRNYNEIIDQWKTITKEIKANIKVLDMPLLDTTTNTSNLTGTFIADLVLQILSYVAETERLNIRTRQAEGIRLAKEGGKHLGRPRAEFPPNFDSVYESWKREEITAKIAMEKLDLKRTTFYKLVKIKEAD
jgi:DNA invertase Pin-like site-specific DNA recombinase